MLKEVNISMLKKCSNMVEEVKQQARSNGKHVTPAKYLSESVTGDGDVIPMCLPANTDDSNHLNCLLGTNTPHNNRSKL